jgi:hypothetical protein
MGNRNLNRRSQRSQRTYSEFGILYGDATTPAAVDDINVDTVTPFPNDADYQHENGSAGPDWIIDADEAGRALIYLRAGGYYPVPVDEDHPDGYAPGTP